MQPDSREKNNQDSPTMDHKVLILPTDPSLKIDPVRRSPSIESQPSPVPVEDGSLTPKDVDIIWQPSYGSIIAPLFSKYLIGLIFITLIGILFGVTFNIRLVSFTGEGLGELLDIASAYIFIPIATVVFVVIAAALRDFTYVAYPSVAFILTNTLKDSTFVNYISGYVPIAEGTNGVPYVSSLVVVALSYVLLHLYVFPIKKILLIKESNDLSRKKIIIVCSVFLAIATIGTIVVGLQSKELFAAQQRDRSAVHIPSSKQYIGSPDSNYVLYHKDKDAVYESVGDVIATRLEQWWKNDTRTVCGNATVTSTHPGQKIMNKYSTTKKGIVYSEAVFSGNSSSRGLATTAYNEYRYCFVVGNYQYSLVRGDGGNKSVLKEHDTQVIIDVIASAPRYLPECLDKLVNYCREKDKKELERLDLLSTHQDATFKKTLYSSGIIESTAKKNAYPTTGKLTIQEWQVSIPLTSGIDDAYYVMRPDGTVVVRLRSLDSDKCFMDGGVAFMRRTLASSTELLPSDITIQGVVIDNYVYSVSGSSYLQLCTNYGFDPVQVDKLTDIFDWAEVNISR